MLDAEEIPVVVDVRDELPVLEGEGLDGTRLEHAGVGYKKVDAAAGLRDVGNHFRDGTFIRDIDCNGERLHRRILRLYGVRRFLRSLGIHVGDHDHCALFGKFFRDAVAESLRGAGDDRHFAFESAACGRIGFRRLRAAVGFHFPVLNEQTVAVAEVMGAAECRRKLFHEPGVRRESRHGRSAFQGIARAEDAFTGDADHQRLEAVGFYIRIDIFLFRVVRHHREGFCIHNVIGGERSARDFEFARPGDEFAPDGFPFARAEDGAEFRSDQF